MQYEWLELLPLKCPPNTARVIEEMFYRLVSTIPLQIDDFFSNRKIFPTKVFNVTECQARACSVYSRIETCRNQKKYSRLKDKKIIGILFTKEYGLIDKTSGKDHYSWWVAKTFNPESIEIEIVDDKVASN